MSKSVNHGLGGEILSLKKDKFDWAFIISFSIKKDHIVRHKKMFKCDSGAQARKEGIKIEKKYSPVFIIVFHKYSDDGPRIVYEKGNRQVIKRWNSQNS